jgi:hypothetical protein
MLVTSENGIVSDDEPEMQIASSFKVKVPELALVLTLNSGPTW